MTQNHFKTLGLKPGANEEEIKKAYRALAKKWHPDKNKTAGAEDRFKEIAAAYEFLKSQDRRETHERDLNRAKDTFTNSSFSYGRYQTNNKASDGADSFFGQNSKDRYKNSTFDHTAEEKPQSNSSKKPHESSQKKKRAPKQRSAPSRSSSKWKPWSNEWNVNDDEDLYHDISGAAGGGGRTSSNSHFSFAFKSFVDDLGTSFDAFFTGPPPPMGQWEFSSFFDGSDPFADLYKQGFFTPLGSQRMPRRPRYRNVAQEMGPEGLDPEYLFTPRARSVASEMPNDASLYESDDDDMDSRLFKCTYCSKRMPFSQLSTHEPGCALRCGGRFDLSDDEEQEDVHKFGGSPEEDQYPQKTGDWRATHEELLKNIRKAKRAANIKTRYHSASTTRSNGNINDDGLAQIKCKWCERNFSHPAAKHHIPFCEKWTKEHGSPLNPAGMSSSRDTGSKSQRARDYSKHIPKPQASSHDNDSDSPRSPRTHFNHYPNVGVHMKRETMNKPGKASSTGLHASTPGTSKDKPGKASGTGLHAFTPGTSKDKPGKASYTGLHASNPGTSKDGMKAEGTSDHGLGSSYSRMNMGSRATGASKFTSHEQDRSSSPFSSTMGDSYGFGVSGSRFKTDPRHAGKTDAFGNDTCTVCKKKYGTHCRLNCTCDIRKTGS